MTTSSSTFLSIVSLVMIFWCFLTIVSNINRVSVLMSPPCTCGLAKNSIVVSAMSLVLGFGFLLKDSASLPLRHLKTVMNICFYFALRTSTLILSVLILGKEYNPIRYLVEHTVISKIYNPRPDIFLKLITRTSTA